MDPTLITLGNFFMLAGALFLKGLVLGAGVLAPYFLFTFIVTKKK